MIVLSISCLIGAVVCLFLNALLDDCPGFIRLILGFIILMTALLAGLMLASNKHETTRLIHRYQQGDYELEIRVKKEKIDTLYVFK